MTCRPVGFLNLPPWHEALREQMKKSHMENLLHAPVLHAEEFSPPWNSLESDEFYSTIETGILFSENPFTDRLPKRVVTNNPAIAEQRLFQRGDGLTGIRGAIGGTFPMIELCEPRRLLPDFQRLLAIPDGVLSFILVHMETTGCNLEDALREAQWQGIAPGNPIRHIHGLVSRERLALLASRIFEIQLPAENIAVDGVGKLVKEDVEIARENNYSIRFIGIVECIPKTPADVSSEGGGGPEARSSSSPKAGMENSWTAWVGPALIPARYLLSQIRGGMEAAYVQFVNKTSMSFSGPGTSKEVVFRGICRDLDQLHREGNFGHPDFCRTDVIPRHKHQVGFYLRISLMDFVPTLGRIFSLFSSAGIEIQKFFQRQNSEKNRAADVNEVVIFTKPSTEENFTDVLEKIRQEVKLAGIKSCIRYVP